MLQNIQSDLPFLECGVERKTKITNPGFSPGMSQPYTFGLGGF